jgi:hypothetical protein
VGCFRRVQGKSKSSNPALVNTLSVYRSYTPAGEESEAVFDEYHAYADPKARLLDEAFIEQFNENTVLFMARRHNWVPPVNPPPSPVSTLDSGLDLVLPQA